MSGPVLITGASGFLGAWIMRCLSREGVGVIACDLRPDETRLRMVMEDDAPASVTWAPLDVSDTDSVVALARAHEPAAIIHLAALLIPVCRDDPPTAVRVNLLGDANVFEAARQIGGAPVVYTSSAAARPRGPMNRVANLYGALKAAGEDMARFYHDDHGVASLGLRPTIVYGVGRDTGDTAIVTAAMKAAATGTSYRLAWRSRTVFELASDVADLYARAALSPLRGAHVSDIGTELRSTDDILAAIRAAVPEADVDHAEDAPERVAPVTGFDNAALGEAVGAIALTPLRDGVSRTIDHFRRLGSG